LTGNVRWRSLRVGMGSKLGGYLPALTDMFKTETMNRRKMIKNILRKGMAVTVLVGSTLVLPAEVLPIAGPLAPSSVSAAGCASRTLGIDLSLRSLGSFMEYRGRSNRCADLNWNTDGEWGTACSVPISLGDADLGFVFYSRLFTIACTQHDFGYYNLGCYEDNLCLSEQSRRDVDIKFQNNMRRRCEVVYPTDASARATCKNWADIFFRGVRTGGWMYW
jgi:hypothetical protein